MSVHGGWELDDGREQDYQEREVEDIESPDLIPEIFSEWPSLTYPTEIRPQLHWSTQWDKHGRKIGRMIDGIKVSLFVTKEEYIRKVIEIHRHFNLTKKLSDIVKGLKAEFGPNAVERDDSDGRTNWFGVPARQLYDRLCIELGGIGVQLILYYVELEKEKEEAAARVLWHLREMRIYLLVDADTGAFSVVNDLNLLNQSRSWRDGGWTDGMKVDDNEIIWFATKNAEYES